MRSTLLLVLVACTAIALVDLVESTHSLSGSQAQALWSHSHKKSHKPDHRKDMRFRTEARSKDESGPAGAGGAGAGGAGGAPGGAGGGGDAGGDKFGPCKTCVFVIERIKKGTNMLLPSICDEIYAKDPQAYDPCHQTLSSLSENGNNVRYWLFEGCYKYEIYQAKEWIKPCPSHVMCSVLKKLDKTPFCAPMDMEDPFAKSGEGSGSNSGGGA